MAPGRSHRRWARRAALLAARFLLPLAAAILLTDCATHPPAPTPAPLPPARTWAERQGLLRAEADHFTLNGRLAATHGSDGVSAGLHWEQQGQNAQMALSGPLGFGGARVHLADGSLTIRTNDGRELSGDAAVAELARLLGFDPPLTSLRFWVLGLPDPGGAPGAPVFDDQQRLSRLQQDGWVIAYDAYTAVQRQWLPRRLTVTREGLRLRLVINDWRL